MNRNLAFFALIVVGLFCSFNTPVLAQKTDVANNRQSQEKCVGEKFILPSSIAIGNKAFENYLKVASLQMKERRDAFRVLSNEEKAGFFKVQYALELVKRPNLTAEQRNFISEAVSKISPDLYDTSNPEKVRLSEQIGQEMESRAFGIFTPAEAGDILAALFAKKDEDIRLLRNYQELLKKGTKERKKIVREMSANDRVNIWKTQLVYHLTTARLTKAQSDLLVEFIITLSPVMFERPADETKEQAAQALEELNRKILSVFSKAEAYAIFEEIGIQQPVVSQSEQDFLPEQPGNVECDCRWYCGPYNGTCGGGACNVMTLECGPFGTWACTHKCG